MAPLSNSDIVEFEPKTDILDRPGRFQIQENFISNQPDLILKIMAQIVIVRAKFNYMKRQFDYEGYSLVFEKVEPGERAPLYVLLISDDEFLSAERIPDR